MSYGTPGGDSHYYAGRITFTSDGTDSDWVDFQYVDSNTQMTETEKEARFQAVIDALASMPNIGVVGNKNTTQSQVVTPTEA